MISTVLGDVSSKLCYLDLTVKLSLETTEKNLTLRRLEPVHNVGNGSENRGLGEQNELLVKEFGILHVSTLTADLVIQVGLTGHSTDPSLSFITFLRRERKFHELLIRLFPLEIEHVLVQVSKILLRFLGCRSTKTFVVLDLPLLQSLGFCLLVISKTLDPRLILRQGVEYLYLFLSFRGFHNRCDELAYLFVLFYISFILVM